MKFNGTRNAGFTLIELLIAMAIGLIAVTVIIQVYASMQASNTTQKLVVEMQQNARAALVLMKRDIRMAGHDPAGTDGIDTDGDSDIDEDDEHKARIEKAEAEEIHFSVNNSVDDPTEGSNGVDDDGDGQIDELDECCYDGDVADPGEDIRFWLDGTQLIRTTVADSVLAYDIDALRFAYAFDNDGDGELDRSVNDNVIWAFASTGSLDLDRVVDTNDDGSVDLNDTQFGTALGSAVPFDAIRAVRIWVLARTRHPIRGNTDSQTYVVGDQHLVVSDGYRRYLLETTVYCRNMGL